MKTKTFQNKKPRVGAQQLTIDSPLEQGRILWYHSSVIRGIGAVGSALPWHGRGQRFESVMLHHEKSRFALNRLFSYTGANV